MGLEWFSHIVDEYRHLSKLNYGILNSYSSEKCGQIWYIMMRKDLRSIQKHEKGGCIGVEMVNVKTFTKP
jgi:hypothetical protein